MSERKVVFMAHPIRGDVQNNVRAAQRILRTLYEADDIIPIAPYLAVVDVLDPESPFGRQATFSADREYFERRFIDQLWLYGDHISSGMREAIDLALDNFVMVVAQTEGTLTDLHRIYEHEKRIMR